MIEIVDLVEKECSQCNNVEWLLKNGLCMPCHTKNIKENMTNS